MKRKMVYALMALLLILCVAIVSEWMKPSAETGEKQITVIVMDESGDTSKQVWEKTYQTDTENLTAFLKEKEELDAAIVESEYGSLLNEIAWLKQDMEKGPWLVFESENNRICVEAGMCPAMDDVLIEDQDVFVFRLISSFSS